MSLSVPQEPVIQIAAEFAVTLMVWPAAEREAAGVRDVELQNAATQSNLIGCGPERVVVNTLRVPG